YSVAGQLTINAANIDQEGYLAAPLGSINLNAGSQYLGNIPLNAASSGRIYLGSSSTTTVAPGDTALLYGQIQLSTDSGALGNDIWVTLTGSKGAAVQVQAVPSQSVSLNGNEVIVRDGALVDVS